MGNGALLLTEMVTRYLGRDPAGVADRLGLKMAEAQERAQKSRG